MDIRETFLKLTSKTYPHGSEAELEGILPDFLETDEFGNKFIQIGESDCMFTSHLDTASSANTYINHVFVENKIKTDGTTILGADDKAGVTIMLYMIENKIPGLYYFFLGEEVGCVGSRALSGKWKTQKNENIKKVISFDRRGTDSVITYQASSRCCSDKFAEELSKQLNFVESNFSYKPDPTGIYTDSAQFTTIYPECTNISVGYYSEHTFAESQDIEHLEKLAKACLNVDWTSLPVERDPSVTDYRSYGGYGYGYGYSSYWDDEDYYGSWGGYSSNYSTTSPLATANKNPVNQYWFLDWKFNHVSSIRINTLTNKIVDIELCDERIFKETEDIISLLKSLDVDFDTIKWDGINLKVSHKMPAGHTTQCGRDELCDFLQDLDFWKKEIESEYKGDSSYEYGSKVY